MYSRGDSSLQKDEQFSVIRQYRMMRVCLLSRNGLGVVGLVDANFQQRLAGMHLRSRLPRWRDLYVNCLSSADIIESKGVNVLYSFFFVFVFLASALQYSLERRNGLNV